MVDTAPQFEQKDLLGSTVQPTGTVGTTAIPIPTVATTPISDFLIRCATDNTPVTKRLLVSTDGGTSFMTLSPGEYVGWPLKGSVTQIIIKGSVAGVLYESLINLEP